MSLSEAEYQTLRDRMAANCGIVAPIETIQPARKNKYGVAPKEERIVNGILFASKAEATSYQQLLVAKLAGQIIGEIELQPRFSFPMGFSYVGDFKVTWAESEGGPEYTEVIDVKGVETAVFKLKRKCMAHFYPDVKLSLWKGKA